MRYKVLISENPLPSILEAEQLRELGLKVPFVPSDPEFNIYAYVPEDVPLDIRKVRAIHYFEDHRIFISEKEYKAHFAKIDEFNHVEVGDKVKIVGYKNLVTEVESIDGDEAITKINLRGYVYRFRNKLSHLSKSEVLFRNREDTFQFTHQKTLYIDLSEYHHVEDPHLYIQDVFHLTLRLKLSHPSYAVALVNPRFGAAELFGFREVLTGSLRALYDGTVRPDDLIYSNDFINWTDKCTFLSRLRMKSFRSIKAISKDQFEHLLNLTTPQNLIVYRRLRTLAKRSDTPILFNKDRIKYLLENDPESLRKRYPACFDFSAVSQNPQVINHGFCAERVYNALLDLKQVKIAENLDYYMTILRG